MWQYLPAVGTDEWSVNPEWTNYSADECAQWETCWLAQQAGQDLVFATDELRGGHCGMNGHDNVTTDEPFEWFDKNIFTGVHRAVRRVALAAAAVWQYLPAVGTDEWSVNPGWTNYSVDECAQWETCWLAQQAGEHPVFATDFTLRGGYCGMNGHPEVTTDEPYEWFDKHIFTGVHRAVRRVA